MTSRWGTTAPPQLVVPRQPDRRPPEVVVVSYRGPVSYQLDGGQRRAHPAPSGGLVTALLSLPALRNRGVWICAAMTPEDHAVAREVRDQPFPVRVRDRSVLVRMVRLDPEAARLTSTVAANPVLWFVQHTMGNLATAPDPGGADAFEAGYEPANAAFADAVVAELDRRGDEAIVMLHDYHLYLVAHEVRRRRPDAFLHHFIHIPWPEPEAWFELPRHLAEQLLRGLLANNIIGFQTEGYARNFLRTCQEVLGLDVDHHAWRVGLDGRSVLLRWYPVSIDPVALRTFARGREASEERAALQAHRPEKLIVRVDRADPTKNIVRGFEAYGQMLRDHPEHRGRVQFLALVQPSRQDVAVYVSHLDDVRRAAAEVNAQFGNPAWQPVDLRVGEGLARAVAAYQEYDVLLVNPIADGMNLVAKEGVALNTRDGVLVLSRGAGAHAELGRFGLSVDPLDVEGQAEALHRALVMDREERHDRALACRLVVERNDSARWLNHQLRDIASLRPATVA